MTQIERLIEWYERGVMFRCGCHEDRLEPAVKRALIMGQLSVNALFRCPLHGEPAMWPEPEVEVLR